MDDADIGSALAEAERAGALAELLEAAHADDGVHPVRDAAGHRLCLTCRDPIDLARLAALPHALRCVPCQKRLDRRRATGA